MADPLSIVGVILSTQQMITSCVERYKTMVNCPRDIQDLREDLEDLNRLLPAILNVLKSASPGSGAGDELNTIQHDTTQRLSTHLQALSTVIKGFPPEMKTWARFKWKEAKSNVSGIKEKIRECEAKLQISLTVDIKKDTNLIRSIISSTILEPERRLSAEAEDRERKEILNWFFAGIVGERHQEIVDKREENTGAWFFETDDFKKWANREVSWLNCEGNPGAGKTFMMSHIVDYVSKMYKAERKASRVGIAFIYFNYMDKEQQKPSWILRNILRQLLTSTATIPSGSNALYENHQENFLCPTLDELKQAVEECAGGFECTWLFFDAFDECADDLRNEILSVLESLSTLESPVQVFVTCRPHTMGLWQCRDVNVIDLTAHEKDIETVVLRKMNKSSRWKKRLPETTAGEILKAVIKRSDGMFFLAACLVDHIMRAHTLKDLKDSLRDLPNDLTEYFKVTMDRIREDKFSRNKELAFDIITWISRASRTFTLEELQIMLSFSAEQETPTEIYSSDHIMRVCLGLVTVGGINKTCRLVHQTFREYLDGVDEEKRYIRQRVRIIVKANLKFICDYSSGTKHSAAETALYQYAVHNWALHLKELPEVDRELFLFIMKCFQNESVGNAIRISTKKSRRPFHGGSLAKPLHAAAFWGITALAERLIFDKCDLNPIDSYGRTPLSWAAENGFFEIVQALTRCSELEETALNIRCGDYGQTPLCFASENGHVEVVKVLIKSGADVNLASENGQTPISWASEKGFEKVVSILLESEGIDVNFRDKAGRSPLSWGLYSRHEAVVKLLVDCEGVDLDPGVRVVWPNLVRYHQTPATILDDLIKDARLKRDQLERKRIPLGNAGASQGAISEPVQVRSIERILNSAVCITLQSQLENSADWMLIIKFWTVSLFSGILAYFVSFLYMYCRGYGAGEGGIRPRYPLE